MNCKPNDIAIIINAHRDYTDCIGRIVKVISLYDPITWLITFDGEIPESVEKQHRNNISIIDEYLRPVSGLDDPEYFEEELVIKSPEEMMK